MDDAGAADVDDDDDVDGFVIAQRRNRFTNHEHRLTVATKCRLSFISIASVQLKRQ